MNSNKNNMTDGVFDLVKEGEIVANIIVGDLMDANLIKKDEDDKAVDIAIRQFLAFRGNIDANEKRISIEKESENLAHKMISAFMVAGLVNQFDETHAREIAAEEILVRRAMESL